MVKWTKEELDALLGDADLKVQKPENKYGRVVVYIPDNGRDPHLNKNLPHESELNLPYNRPNKNVPQESEIDLPKNP